MTNRMKSSLMGSAAVIAVAYCVAGAAPAMAQCVTSASTVACNGTATDVQLQGRIAAATRPDLTITVNRGATITTSQGSILVGQSFFPPQQPFPGMITLNNAGTIGTSRTAPITLSINGVPGAASNNFVGTNSGLFNGSLNVTSLGGRGSLQNSGTITGTVTLTGRGDQTYSGAGAIHGGPFPFAGSVGLNVASVVQTSSFDSVTQRSTTSFAGGTASATIDGTLRALVNGAPTGIFVGATITGIGGANATINGAVGQTTVRSLEFNQISSSVFSFANGVQTFTSTSVFQAVGGMASLVIGANGSINGSTFVTGFGGASATVNGTAGQDFSTFAVTSVFNDSTGSSTNSFSFTPGGSTNSFANQSTASTRGGLASLIVNAGGTIFGDVNVQGGTAASATINGTVGSSASSRFSIRSLVSDSSSSGSGSTVNTPTSSTSTGTSQSSFTNVATSTSLTIGATGVVRGDVDVSTQRGTASVTVAGRSGTAGQFGSFNVLAARSEGFDETTSSSLGSAGQSSRRTLTAVGGTAAVIITDSGLVAGSARATAHGGAIISNAGRVTGALIAAAGGRSTTTSFESTFGTSVGNGISTTVGRTSQIDTGVDVAADASILNTGTAGSIIASATRNVSFRNDGTVSGTIGLTTGGIASSTSESFDSTTVVPTFGDPVRRTTEVNTRTVTARATGGNVVAFYGGTVGVASPGNVFPVPSVNQSAQGSSDATIAGTMFANFSGITGATNTNSTSMTTTVTVLGSTTGSRTTTVTNSSSTTVTGGASTVLVTGQVRNNGSGTGSVASTAATGVASALVNGGRVERDLAVTAGAGINLASALDRSELVRGTVLFGSFQPTVLESSSERQVTVSSLAGGSASATLTNAFVGGQVNVSGVGTGAGVLAASASIDAASTAGALRVVAGGRDNRFERTITFANNVQTFTSANADTVSALAGDARADVAGRINGDSLIASEGGSALFSLTGVAAGAVNVIATASERRSTTTESLQQGFRLTASATTTTNTARGGLATLAIASGAGVPNAVGGAIVVDGFSGSVLTIGAGARVLANNGGDIRVGATSGNSSFTSTSRFDPVSGVSTGLTFGQSFTPVAGPASITNAGIIGAGTSFFAAPVTVRAVSVGGATIGNAGQIFGDVIAAALGERREVTTVVTPATQTAPETSVTTSLFAPVGAAARITNAGVISGRAEVAGSTGAVTNTGVIRGAVQLGAAVRNFTTATTTTRRFGPTGLVETTVTSPTGVPATLFAQTLTLDQNGLLIGGVRVTGATIADPAGGAPIRTSAIAATVNLNPGSITLGTISADQDATGRLTRTAVNLNGEGFLGAGANLPAAPAGAGSRFTSVPNFGAFLAVDAALGSLGAAGFTPSAALDSGSRILGVDTITKTGSGTFTIVGGSLLRSTATPLFTIDAGLTRIAGGELQLGVVGGDPASGQSVFGIRGDLQNDGVLVVGRRVATDTLAGVDGVNLLVTGNLTQSAGGVLVLGGALTPALATGPSLATRASLLTVDGALTLNGAISIAIPAGIYISGRGPDIANVGGAVTGTAVVNAFASPFVGFGLTQRVEAGRTIVSLGVSRTAYASVATNTNAAAGAGALQAAIPAAVAAGAGSDLANVILGLDTGTASGAALKFDDLGQASFYASLAQVATTRPFGEVQDALAGIGANGGRPVSLWVRTSGTTARTTGNAAVGARTLNADTYGTVLGLGYSGDAISLGIGGGPIWSDAGAGSGRGRADGWLIGAYAAGRLGPVSLAAQGVASWTDWSVTRSLPGFGRFAAANFDSNEVRVNGRAAIDLKLGGKVTLSPFAGIEWRRWQLNGFAERNAGAVGVTGTRASNSVVSPELGANASLTTGKVRAFVEGVYVFQQDIGAIRSLSLVGAPASFTVQGVDPGDFGRASAGIEVDIGRGSLFLRGDGWSGGGNSLGTVRAGARIRF